MHEPWEELDPEGPSAEDLDRLDYAGVSCPNCGSDQYDQQDTCTVCGSSLSMREARGLPDWAKIALCAVLAAFVLFFVL